MNTAQAVKVLTRALKSDEGYWISWKANIAMAYQDEGHRQKSRDSNAKRHAISDKAAENFLNLLCGLPTRRGNE